MESKTLHILWTNDNPLTAEFMVFMYATNSLLNQWWEDVHLIVWGATTKLLCESEDMQRLLKTFQEAGGRVSACRRCAEKLGLTDRIKGIEGVKVFYIGEHFTEILQGNDKLITI